jgi:molybdenum-dependent DNA-binding transcriptional regulator ModE
MVGKVDSHPAAASPDDVEWLVDQVRTLGSAAAAAKSLDLERTMVWRVAKGRKVSRSSVLEIRKRREMVLAADPTRSPLRVQELSVANLRAALQYLLHAVDALDPDERASAKK